MLIVNHGLRTVDPLKVVAEDQSGSPPRVNHGLRTVDPLKGYFVVQKIEASDR